MYCTLMFVVGVLLLMVMCAVFNVYFLIFQDMFEPYLKSFFVRSSDPTHIKALKLEVSDKWMGFAIFVSSTWNMILFQLLYSFIIICYGQVLSHVKLFPGADQSGNWYQHFCHPARISDIHWFFWQRICCCNHSSHWKVSCK